MRAWIDPNGKFHKVPNADPSHGSWMLKDKSIGAAAQAKVAGAMSAAAQANTRESFAAEVAANLAIKAGWIRLDIESSWLGIETNKKLSDQRLFDLAFEVAIAYSQFDLKRVRKIAHDWATGAASVTLKDGRLVEPGYPQGGLRSAYARRESVIRIARRILAEAETRSRSFRPPEAISGQPS